MSLIISIIIWGTGYSQSLFQTYNLGYELYNNEQYAEAIEVFQRVYYFDKNDSLRRNVSEKIAQCYFELGELRKSDRFLDFAYNLEKRDSLRNALIFKKVLNLYLLNEYQFALVELFSMSDNLNKYQEREKNFYYGLLYYQQHKFSDSQKYFENCFSNHIKLTNKLDSLFSITNNMFNKKPQLSRYLSMFIPGMGQLINGAYKSAINSFILTGSLFLLYGYTAVNYSTLDALLSVMPWFMRYHKGGYDNAYKISQKRQNEKHNKMLIEIIEMYDSNNSFN